MEGVREITKNGAKFMDGQEREFDSIVLATGYKSNVPSWLKVCMRYDVTRLIIYSTCLILTTIYYFFTKNLKFIFD